MILFAMALCFLVFLIFCICIKIWLLPWKPSTIKDFRGKRIVITGATKGIGKCLAQQTVRLGGHVTLVARNLDQLQETAKELMDLRIYEQQQIYIIPLDLTDDFARISIDLSIAFRNQPEMVDILINNVGGSVDETFENLKPEDFERQIRLNYLSAVYMTRCLLPALKRAAVCSFMEGARIVFLSSQAGQVGLYGYTAYSASKFALRGFAESLQMELASSNIRITVAYPPNTDTEGFEQELKSMPYVTRVISEMAGLAAPEKVAKKILDDCCVGRFCSSFGSDGWLLANACAGMSPEMEVLPCIQQFFLNGLLRLISLFYLRKFERIVLRHS